MKIGQGNGTNALTITLNYCPQYLFVPTNTTRLVVTVNDNGTTVDLDGTAIQQYKGLSRYNAVSLSNATSEYNYLQLADGKIENLVTTIEYNFDTLFQSNNVITAYSNQLGANLFLYKRDTVLANSGKNYSNFVCLAFNDFSPSDELNVTFSNGYTEKLAPLDLLDMVLFQQGIQSTTDVYSDGTVLNTNQVLYNFGAIRLVNYIPIFNKTISLLTLKKAKV